MTKKEAIDTLKLMQAQVEWEYPMDYSVAIDMAIAALTEESDASDCCGCNCPNMEPALGKSEIVRCKDCAYYLWDCIDMPYGMTKMVCWCDFHYDAGNENLAVNPDDYCKWAERREE